MTAHRFRSESLLFLSAAVLAGCTRGRGSEAKAQYTGVLVALKAGSLTEAYAAALPPSHDRELNELLAQARELLDEEEFALLKETLAKTGPKIAPAIALFASGSPAMKILSERVKDLPAALGLGSYSDFKAQDLKALLHGFDRGFFKDVSRAEDYRARLETVAVDVAGEKGDWAKLRFSARSAGGAVSEDTMEVIAVEGKWVPAAWAADWARVMGDLRSMVAEAKAGKEKNPAAVKGFIRSLEGALEPQFGLLEMLKKLGEAFGGEENANGAGG